MILALVTFALHASATEIPLPPEFVPVQQSFYRRSAADFAAKVSAKLPDLRLPRADDFHPTFDSRVSRKGWIENFVNEMSEQKVLSAGDRERLRSTAEDLFFSYHHDEGYPRFSFLAASESGSAHTPAKKAGREWSLAVPLPVSFSSEPHTLNLRAYVDERFPIELQEFVRARKVTLLLDRQGCARSVRDSGAEGYPKIIRFSNTRDYAESPTYFAQTADGKGMRFVVCDLYGNDDVRRARAFYGPFFAEVGGRLLEHADHDPLMKFNVTESELRPRTPDDLVVIGFQNSVWWDLKTVDASWIRTSISDDGAEASFFTYPKTGERIVSVANIYGDEMTEVLRDLYSRGYRRFVYLGTAGGLDPSLAIGDLLVPAQFRDARGKLFSFQNTALRKFLSVPAGNRVWRSSIHGWVPNLIVETQNYLAQLRRDSVQAIDVEALYFAKFFTRNQAAEHAAYILVSDLPLHGASYDKQDSNRDRPMNSLKSVLPMIIPSLNR